MGRDVLSGLAVVMCFASGCASGPPPAAPPPVALIVPPPAPAPLAASRAATPAESHAPPAPAKLTVTPLALPGVSGAASLDYIAYDAARGRVWVPVGTTGSVDVLDVATRKWTRVDGFRTAARVVRGASRTIGPSSAAVGGAFVYVGDRATSEVCPVDAATLARARCLKLKGGIDGVAYAASAKEVWVTTPDDQAIVVLDASHAPALSVKATVKIDGAPEGYALDEGHGLFFTNTEDKGTTAVIDVKTHAVKTAWHPGCDAKGPRGLAFDAARDLLVVACTDHVAVLDAAHDGALLGQLDTGAGLDNLDMVGDAVYAAAGGAARLTVARVDARGHLAVVATAETSPGARNAVASAAGEAFVADSPGGRLLVASTAR